VTVLTSLDNRILNEIGVEAGTATQVERLARLAMKAGLRGLVCSPLEIAGLKVPAADDEIGHPGNSRDGGGCWRPEADDDGARSARRRSRLACDRPANLRSPRAKGGGGTDHGIFETLGVVGKVCKFGSATSAEKLSRT